MDFPKSSEDKTRLFVGYSRFEFALKETGYLARDKDGVARANWARFAKEDCLGDVMQEALQNPDARELAAEPPETQVTDDCKSWRWEPRMEKPVTTLFMFLVAAKGVRDNLFHGGKHGEDPRDDKLCRAAWHVLELCLKRHHEVRNAFEGKY